MAPGWTGLEETCTMVVQKFLNLTRVPGRSSSTPRQKMDLRSFLVLAASPLLPFRSPNPPPNEIINQIHQQTVSL